MTALLLLVASLAPPAVHAAPIQSSPIAVTIVAKKGTRRLLCSVDGATSKRCKARARFILAAGRHTISVRAVYARGTSPPRTVTVVVPEPAPPRVDVEGNPVGIAAESGIVWVSDGESGNVTRIDATSRSVVNILGVGQSLGGIAASPDAVWVSDFPAGTVIRIDPATDTVTGRVSVGGAPSGIAVSPGAVWVGNLNGYITRIDPSSNGVVAKIDLPSGASMPLVARGLTWVGLQHGSVVSIDPATNRLTGNVITVDPDVDALADSPAGIWVSTFDGSVALLDPTARRVTVKRRLPGRGSGIAFAGGSVWASVFDASLVVRLDPTTGALLGAVKTGLRAREAVAAGGYLWVLAFADGAVTPIPLPAASPR